MRSRYWIVAFLVFVAGMLPLTAGLTQLNSVNDLASSRVNFSFSRVAEDSDGGRLFRAWGMTIESADGSAPRISSDLLGGQPVSFLSNSNDGASANVGLILNLTRSARQMGFTLRNGNSETQATITVFDNLGVQLGQIVVNQVTTSFGPFVGFETDNPDETFTKVIIDYGPANNAEQILDLQVTFAQTPFFTSFLAQVADGAFSGNLLQTSLVVTNLTNTTAMGEIQVRGDDGAPLDMAFVDDETGAVLAPAGFGDVVLFPIGPFSSRSFTTAANRSPPVQGYAEIRSNMPIATTAVFRAIIDGVAFEAGVGGERPAHRISAAVSQEAPSFSSGIAVANPNVEPAEALLHLVSGGSVIATNTTFLSLDPGEHVAGFLSQLFPQISDNFRGSILITSAVPLVVTVLRTANGGVVSASLPVGGTENN